MAFQSPADLSMKSERVLLEKYFAGVQARVTRETLEQLADQHRDITMRQGTMYREFDPVFNQMTYAMRIWLLKSMHIEKKTLSIDAPATWVDHLKDAMLKSGKGWQVWIAGRFASPRYVTTTKEVDTVVRVCPHNDTYFSEDRLHIEWLLWKHD